MTRLLADHDKFLWLLESGDEMTAVYNCMRINSGATIMGVLVVSRNHLYIFDHCLVNANGEVSIFSHEQNLTEKPAPTPEAGTTITLQGGGWSALEDHTSVRKWTVTQIRDIQKRKYLLRPVSRTFLP